MLPEWDLRQLDDLSCGDSFRFLRINPALTCRAMLFRVYKER
jgi:hypothetical protein